MSENSKNWLSMGLALFLFGIFLKLSSEFLDNDVDYLDHQILSWAESLRFSALDQSAIEITALGSMTVVALFVFAGVLVCWFLKNYFGLCYLFISSLGAAALIFLLKNFFERPRPNASLFLVDASGYSYPSGHSFGSAAVYFSIAVVCASYTKDIKIQMLFFLLAALFVGLVGVSRIYLGVHYPSDVASGMLLGTAWSLLSFSFIKIVQKKADQQRNRS